MVKIFSVDWMAQSHYEISPKEALGLDNNMTSQSKPHVPCMVQPRPPTSYEKICLQPKPKTTRIVRTETIEKTNQDSSLDSALQPTICSSPSFSENSGYSSGYESEATLSELPSMEEGSEGESDATQRRMRTKFTPEQIHKMEKIFNKNRYLDAGERAKTALKLNLSETQVRTWFQNRRMKRKREVMDLRAEYAQSYAQSNPTVSPMVFQQMHPFQYPGFSSGQQLSYAPAPPPANHPLYQMMPHIPMQQMVSRHPQQTMMSSQHYY